MGPEGYHGITNRAGWAAGAAFAGAVIYQIACAPNALADDQSDAAHPTDATISHHNGQHGDPLDQYTSGSSLAGTDSAESAQGISADLETSQSEKSQSGSTDTADLHPNQTGFFDLPAPKNHEGTGATASSASETETASTASSAQDTSKWDRRHASTHAPSAAGSSKPQQPGDSEPPSSVPAETTIPSTPNTPSASSTDSTHPTDNTRPTSHESPASSSGSNHHHGGVSDPSSQTVPKPAPKDTGIFNLPVPGQRESTAAPQPPATPEAQTAPTPEFALPITLPTAVCTSKIEQRINPVTHQAEWHKGYDIAAPLGTPIYSATDGKVLYSRAAHGYGNWIVIETSDGVVVTYGHMKAQDLLVKAGQVVKAGQLISRVGAEGQATGPHLHFQMNQGAWNGSLINPEDYLRQHAGLEICQFPPRKTRSAPESTPAPAPSPSPSATSPGSTPATSAGESAHSSPVSSSSGHPSEKAAPVNTGLFNLPVPGQASTTEAPKSSPDTTDTSIFDLPVPGTESPKPTPAPTPPAAPTQSETNQPESVVSKYMPLLDTISIGESHGNYDAYFRHGDNVDSPPLTEMSIAQVLAFQHQYVAQQVAAHEFASSAAGKYEMLESTLSSLTQQMHLDPNTKFDAHVQDAMAVELLKKRGLDDFEQGKITWQDFAHLLSEEWASLPDVEGPFPNASHYSKDGVNKAQISIDQIHQAIETVPHR